MHDSSRIRPWALRILPAAAILAGFLACTLSGKPDVAPQEWWSERGPVVPHDSFPADCSLCHTGEDWRAIRADFAFDHGQETGVPLEGAHAEAECLRCHNDRGPVAVFASKGCAGCHENVHRGKLGENCQDCHDQVDWRPKEQIALHNRRGFPLIGSHAVAACWRCHPGAQEGSFVGAPTECVSCHQEDLARALDPDHVAMGWIDRCERCHVPTSWEATDFEHTSFPLLGRHRSTGCTQCHVGGVFAGTPSQCEDCHLAEYQATTSPNHASAGFPTTCAQCHKPTGWTGSAFNHAIWPLTGRHRTASCSACHGGGVYAGTPDQCVDCHLAEYQATTDPSHVAAGFPTSCDSCHDTSGWSGAKFQHSFPITSGPHKVLDCTDCHLDPMSFTTFSCTHCHEHRQSEMDDDHDEVQGYVWSSPACYQCHPDGKE